MTQPDLACWTKDVVLKDGATLRLRPIRSDDGQRMIRFFHRLSPLTVYRRFMGPVKLMDEARVRRFTHLDLRHEMALVGIIADPGEPEQEKVVAVGRYARLSLPTHAEVAFVVEDNYQGLGIGTHLLQELLPFAHLAEIEVLEAEVLAENRGMLGVFQSMGFEISTTLREGVFHIEFAFGDTPLSQERRWAREQAARSAVIGRLFRPRSVAVVGASERPDSLGNAIVRNLIEHGFTGPVYPVNPRHHSLHGLPCHPAVTQVPDAVDLAVVAVPADQVLQVVRDCAESRVYALAIVSAGFAETNEQGRARQHRLAELAHGQGMRVVGPNCLGLVNTDDAIRLNATSTPVLPPRGRVAIGSQSGALGIAMLELARDLHLGISQFIGLGNKADISGNDLLSYWGSDPDTGVILLYLESFGNPRKFSRIARRVGREKPIVVLKGGTSLAGARAAGLHTGAAPAPAPVVDTLLRQAGIVRTETMEQFFNVAKVLGTQPLPQGNRLAVLTNAGGPGILSADRAEGEGLRVPTLSSSLQDSLMRGLPEAASAANPVDMGAGASPAHYAACLKILLDSPEVEQVLVMFIPPLATGVRAVARAVIEAREGRGAEKPLVACLMGSPGDAPALAELEQVGVPTFRFPEDAVVALAQQARYREWRGQERGQPVRFQRVAREQARTLIGRFAGTATGEQPVWLPGQDAAALLSCYGLPVPDGRSPSPRRQWWLAMHHDAHFGPVLMAAPAGAAVSSAAVQRALHPLTDADADRLLHGLAAALLPQDGQGESLEAPPEQDALEEALREDLREPLLRLSQLVEEQPQVRELELQGLGVTTEGTGRCVGRVRVAVAAVDPYQEYVMAHLED